MPPGNTLVGDDVIYASDSPEVAHPFPVSGKGGVASVTTDEANRVANYVAFLVLIALAVLILIRLGGLQGMIAVGRGA